MVKRLIGVLGGICFLAALVVSVGSFHLHSALTLGVPQIICCVGLLLAGIGLLANSRVTSGIGGIVLLIYGCIVLVVGTLSVLFGASILMSGLMVLLYALFLMLACFVRPATMVLGILSGVFIILSPFISGSGDVMWLPSVLQGVGAIFLGISFGKQS